MTPARMTAAEFEDAVADALDSVPQRLLDRLDNVVILVEDEPAPEHLPADGGTLFGLYVGIPLPERMDAYRMGTLPDRIYVYRGPLMRHTATRAELVDQIRVTVLHEIGHHFGIDDDRLHELGWA